MSAISNAICSIITSLPPAFARIDGRPGFWFRAPNPPVLHSFIVVQHSAKHRAIGLDVASSVLRNWDKSYGQNQLIRATGLVNVRLGSSMTPMEEGFYKYKDDFYVTVNLIRDHLKEFALPWFAKHAVDLASDPLVHFGIRRIEQPELPTVDQLRNELIHEALRIGASNWHRRQSTILALHLLAWANERRSDHPT